MTDSPILSFADPTLAHTPLNGLHRKLGARMIPFAHYDMPVNYPTGILAEHLHTRAKAGLFDVSHMGQAILEGRNAALRLESLVPGDIQSLAPGRIRYTQFLNDKGNILDDLMVARLADGDARERLFLVVNADTKARDFGHIGARLPDLTLTVLSDRALVALQGPKAGAVLGRHLPSAATMPFMSWRREQTGDFDLFISRCGYTGEDGFEISVPSRQAASFAELLLADADVWPIGLGARDSLRLEAGLCLYGHDIDSTTNPIEAGLAWSISKRRSFEGGFPGDRQIWLTLQNGCARRLVGLLVEGKVPAREGAPITTLEERVIGRVTSGGFAPSLARPISMGYVETSHATPGTKLHLLVRGKALAAEVTTMPFVPHRYYRGP
ncbi:glycine cleavage system aminomethyltransferase GcvT [Methylovirgula sp. HY1]|uniref:glycine cleavage system aminomethyltransferase GcvT n=1 Tax=Methylovirgula sp. HY1 TaxID=2822761 RepID=UPI001C5B7D11|nr:glycine cleavage system aminomethyltransferase GcvT [Methylovirgula sp. HY1]QXX74536.1 Aminomethyltransferase [Methylovirgula sp. HY1]